MILFYCGVSNMTWNGVPADPGPLACVSPVYGKTARTTRVSSVRIPSGTLVIQDSGAFSDAKRLSFAEALERQMAHAENYGYADKIEYRASYDCLVDEKFVNDIRHKERHTREESEVAVNLTIQAAEYMAAHRQGSNLILSAQGVYPEQYLACADRVIDCMDVQRDCLGLGGWCITGRAYWRMMPVFRDTMRLVIPAIASRGVRRVHLWGVLLADALAFALYLCDLHGICLSTDSAGPVSRLAYGQWGYADWKSEVDMAEPMGIIKIKHVAAVRRWLADFRETEQYKAMRMFR